MSYLESIHALSLQLTGHSKPYRRYLLFKLKIKQPITLSSYLQAVIYKLGSKQPVYVDIKLEHWGESERAGHVSGPGPLHGIMACIYLCTSWCAYMCMQFTWSRALCCNLYTDFYKEHSTWGQFIKNWPYGSLIFTVHSIVLLVSININSQINLGGRILNEPCVNAFACIGIMLLSWSVLYFYGGIWRSIIFLLIFNLVYTYNWPGR